MSSRRQEALDYHSQGRPGKIQVTPTKPFKDQRDLSLAYTPGVAEPCLEIAKNPDDAYVYTTKGNLVAGVEWDCGPWSGQHRCVGRQAGHGRQRHSVQGVADIDVFDLEVESENPEDVIRFCQLLEPTVGGINLEDIRSPTASTSNKSCYATLGIPVFHDDQHGTAIISVCGAAECADGGQKDLAKAKVVFAGAGAAAIATAEHYVRLGVARQHRDVRPEGRDFQGPRRSR